MTAPIDIDRGFPRRDRSKLDSAQAWAREETDRAVAQVFELSKVSPTNATIEAQRKLGQLGRDLEQAMARIDDLERKNKDLLERLYGEVER